MVSYTAESKLGTEKIIEKAIVFFGPAGLGLTLNSRSDAGLIFEGGGGHVGISLGALKKGSRIEVETLEWDYQVKEFLAKL